MSAMRLTSGVLLVCALVALPHSGPMAAGAEAQRTRAPFVLEDATIASVHAAFAARRMLDYQRGLQRAFKEPETDEPAYDSVKSVFAGATRELVDALLYKDEAPLPNGVAGDPAFTAAFAAGAIRTQGGEHH